MRQVSILKGHPGKPARARLIIRRCVEPENCLVSPEDELFSDGTQIMFTVRRHLCASRFHLMHAGCRQSVNPLQRAMLLSAALASAEEHDLSRAFRRPANGLFTQFERFRSLQQPKQPGTSTPARPHCLHRRPWEKHQLQVTTVVQRRSTRASSWARRGAAITSAPRRRTPCSCGICTAAACCSAAPARSPAKGAPKARARRNNQLSCLTSLFGETPACHRPNGRARISSFVSWHAHAYGRCRHWARAWGGPAPAVDLRSAPAGAVPERWQSGDVFSVRQQPGGGRVLAAACSDGDLRTWVAEGGGLRAHRRVRCHRSIGSAVAWSPDGTYVASLSKDGEIVLWVRTYCDSDV